MTVRATLRGHLARTEFEITYRNSMPRQTSGRFHFPLPADAEVSDLGLWFDGRLRHAVAVERVLARQAYDEVVHRAVDPALVEWSVDQRSFDLDVFPIPANGEKKVFIAYDQELTSNDYELDLRYAQNLARLDVQIDAGNRAVTNDRALYRVARDEEPTALVARDGDTWYAAAPIDITPRTSNTPPASHVVIFYDTSSSSVQQNRESLTRFLSAFLAKQQARAAADIIPFHIALEPTRRIETIGSPNTRFTLQRILDEQQPFGATNLIAAASRIREIANQLPPSTRIVLVTDGLTSLGDSHAVAATFAKLGESHRPVLLVNASPSGDALLLDRAARATGGWSIDLTRTSVDDAVAIAMRTPVDVALGETLVPSHVLASSATRVVAAMRAQQPIASFANLPLREMQNAVEVSMVRRAYARAVLRELIANDAPDDQLVSHGRAFTQLTPRTSLLVLESWRDYEAYGIDMPADVAEMKARELEELARRHSPAPSLPLPPKSATPGLWNVRGRVMDSAGAPLPGVTMLLRNDGVPISADVTDANGHYLVDAPAAPQKPSLIAQLEGFNPQTRVLTSQTPSGTQFDFFLDFAAVSESITVTAEGTPQPVDVQSAEPTSLRTKPTSTDALLDAIASGDAVVTSDDPEVAATVAKQRHTLIDRVIAKLRSIASTQDRIRYYLNARALLGGDKSFHIFAALAFRERSPEVAARVVSDLAEANPNNAPLLRILARLLEGWDETALAELLLQHAIEIAPLETQSWRELILLEARLGRGSEVAMWSRRLRDRTMTIDPYDDVRTRTEEALARWQSASFLDRVRGIDLRVPRDTDLEVELMYDTSWSYVDLHVLEPSGEDVAWNNTKSKSGATHTGGYVFGYGPQIYTLPHAPRGGYQINADYYSDDESNVSLESLAHVIVHKRGKRTDHFVVLRFDDETKRVTTVTID